MLEFFQDFFQGGGGQKLLILFYQAQVSLHTNFHAPRTILSGRIQMGQKSGLFIIFIILLFSCEYKASQASLQPQPLPGVGNLIAQVENREIMVLQKGWSQRPGVKILLQLSVEFFQMKHIHRLVQRVFSYTLILVNMSVNFGPYI